jgi:hypothetical protein
VQAQAIFANAGRDAGFNNLAVVCVHEHAFSA